MPGPNACTKSVYIVCIAHHGQERYSDTVCVHIANRELTFHYQFFISIHNDMKDDRWIHLYTCSHNCASRCVYIVPRSRLKLRARNSPQTNVEMPSTLLKVVFTISKWRRHSPKVIFTIQGEDDFWRKSSSLFKITETELPRQTETDSGRFLPNYRDQDWSFEITETDYRAHMLATVPTFA